MASSSNPHSDEPRATPVLLYLSDDGGCSCNDFITRPISTHIHANVYQANRTGAIAALCAWPPRGRVLNLCHDEIEDVTGRVDGDLAIEDSAAMQVGDAADFLRATADRIEAMSRGADWVVVNCQAGVNRSSAALLAWLLRHQHLRLSAAKAVLKDKKRQAATRLRFKNRYQSFAAGGKTEHAFSWPTLCGRSAPTLSRALTDEEAVSLGGSERRSVPCTSRTPAAARGRGKRRTKAALTEGEERWAGITITATIASSAGPVKTHHRVAR